MKCMGGKTCGKRGNDLIRLALRAIHLPLKGKAFGYRATAAIHSSLLTPNSSLH